MPTYSLRMGGIFKHKISLCLWKKYNTLPFFLRGMFMDIRCFFRYSCFVIKTILIVFYYTTQNLQILWVRNATNYPFNQLFLLES